MTITFKLRKKKSTKTGKNQVIVRVNDGREFRKDISLDLHVYEEHWNSSNKTLKSTHPYYEDTVEILDDLKNKASVALNKYNLKRFSRQDVIDHMQGKSDFETVRSFMHSVMKLSKTNRQTYKDYEEKYDAVEKVISPNRELTFEDWIRGYYNYFETFYNFAKDKIKNGDWSPVTYKSRVSAVKRLLTYAHDKRVIHETIPFPKDFSNIEGLKRKVKAPVSKDIYSNINKIRTVEQWLSLSQWVLMFAMRGLYPADVVSLTEKWLINKDGKPRIRSLSAIKKDELYIRKPRSKTSQEMLIKIHRDTTFTLLQIIKNVVAYVYYPNRPEAVADINDTIAIYGYSQAEDEVTHERVWGRRKQTLREKFGTSYSEARKSVSTTLTHFEMNNIINNSMSKYMRGRVVDAIDKDSYVDMLNNNLIDNIDNAHDMLLEDFKIDAMIKALVKKLHELVNDKRYPKPKWLLQHSSVHKVGREYKVMVGMENGKILWEKIDKKYKGYFNKCDRMQKGYWTDEDTWFDTDLRKIAYDKILEAKETTQEDFVRTVMEMERKAEKSAKKKGIEFIPIDNDNKPIERANFVKDIGKNPHVREIEEKSKRMMRIVS
jgi:hypothetical protein